jgi:uncharacterized membrane protein required for colicin V production
VPRTIALNWIDWITLAIVLVSMLRGIRSGVLAEVVELGVLVAAYLAAAVLYPQGVAFIHRVPVLPRAWEGLVSFLVIWLVLYGVAASLVRWALGRAIFPGSRVLGGLVGGVRGLVLVTALLFMSLAAPFHRVVATDSTRSLVAPTLLRWGDRLESALLPLAPVPIPRLGPGGRRF